ncbi:MAG: CDP-glycerol glycerophosphotransferase family protein [Sphaerochaetaceae bacterium]|nr:CDP-glycerol glycerophosphotransferase family protein [Sphaerochaetaceae bacterium]
MIVLYIDPGTGSMLFSLLIGFVTIFYFFMKALWIKIRFLFSGGNVNKIGRSRLPIVVYCEHKRYWGVFKPILDSFENKSISVTYFTSSEDDPAFNQKYSFVTCEYIGEGNRAFAKLNFLEADVCLMTTPALDVYQLKRSPGVLHYAHILHAVGDATGYRLFGLDYFDSILLNGSYQINDIRELEQQRGTKKKDLVVVGCPYLDELMIKYQNCQIKKEQKTKTILVAPSWGPSGILSRYGTKFLDPLSNTGYKIIVRPHPQSLQSEKDVLESLRKRYEGKNQLVWDFEADNFNALHEADLLISDYSSVMFDYVFLFDRPLLYLNADFDIRPYDAGDLDHLPWKLRILPSIGIELKVEDFQEIDKILAASFNNIILQENRKKAKAEAWEHIGESGMRTADFLINTQRTLYQEKG